MIEQIDQTKYTINPIHISRDLKTYAEKNMPLLYSFSVLEKVNES